MELNQMSVWNEDEHEQHCSKGFMEFIEYLDRRVVKEYSEEHGDE
jgi:hypothetical protein